MTAARELEKEDWRELVTKAGTRCEAFCPICKHTCMGHSGHLYLASNADVRAHQCSRHWWLSVLVMANRVVNVSGNIS